MRSDQSFAPRVADIQMRSRAFARNVLCEATHDAESSATAEERFLATRPAFEAIVREGFLLACIPESAGGTGNGLIETAIIAEEFYTVNASLALTMIGTVLGLAPVLVGGTSEQRNRLLAPFLQRTGAPLAAFCSSEPGGSANAGAPHPGEGVRTTARLAGDVWIINGRKRWVSSATGWQRDAAELLCVVARTGADAGQEEAISVLAVQKPVDGLVFERAVESVGHRSHLLAEFSLVDVTTSDANLLGQQGAGLALTSESFTGASALVGILGVGLMRAAFDFSLTFARNERRGGAHPIIDHQAVGYALADAKMSIEAARSLGWRACRAIDSHDPAAQELANYSKIFGSETAVRVITDLMRVVGVESYDTECPLPGLLQDALALPIFSGGNLGVRRRQLHGMLRGTGYNPVDSTSSP